MLKSAVRQREAELREALASPSGYGAGTHGGCGEPLWDDSVTAAVEVERCRADSPYLWQLAEPSQYSAALERVLARPGGPAMLCGAGGEDGLFGAFTVSVPAAGGSGQTVTVSRDLLDSANELAFLESRLGCSSWPLGTAVVDLGAGYGRLEHRAAAALPHLRLLATDAVPLSLALCEAYLAARGVPCSRAKVVLPAALPAEAAAAQPRLAVAVHSLQEMPLAAVRWWLEALAAARVRHLFVATNTAALEPPAATLRLATDAGEDLLAALEEAGFRLARAEPKYSPGSGGGGGGGDAPATVPAFGDCTYCLFELAGPLPAQLTPAQLLPARPPAGSASVVNLASRADRRRWVEASCATALRELGVEAGAGRDPPEIRPATSARES